MDWEASRIVEKNLMKWENEAQYSYISILDKLNKGKGKLPHHHNHDSHEHLSGFQDISQFEAQKVLSESERQTNVPQVYNLKKKGNPSIAV